MRPAAPEPEGPPPSLLREALGYVNFSSGASDAKFLGAVNALYEHYEGGPGGDREAAPTIDRLLDALSSRLDELAAEGGAFADATQAEGVLRLARAFRATYADFHSDLLWGRADDRLWRPMFVGRVFETILTEGGPWDSLTQEEDVSARVDTIRDRFDDYLGYRPVAVLEAEHRVEPYRNEWLRPIPLYVASAGAANGPFRVLIERALEILRETDDDLLRAAWFDPEMVEEIALDPREYDFDHPAHKRPNHHFGQWDPDRIDEGGNYRRFVLQPTVLEELAQRVEREASAEGAGRDELEFEAAAVLAGTMLMASGVSGSGPGAHSSEDTLATLLPHIAAYRDRFYADLLERAPEAHAARLREEAERLRQPFAGARQDLNRRIAERRARQVQQVHLARVYARMGRADAALEEAAAVKVASARILCQLYCRLTEGHQALDARDFAAVAELLPEIEGLLERGIQCGALVDPWNVVGFGGNFSLFPAIENTVHDYRVDDLIELVEQVLGLCSRACTEAAAVDDSGREELFSTTLERLSNWWDQFATPAVSDVRRLYAKEIEISTNLVSGALNAWHKAGAAAGDIGFWGMFVDQFDSPKAFQLVVEALLDKGDLVASMALLMRWLCQVDQTPLEDGEASFHPLADRWLREVERRGRETGEDQWPLVSKLFDHLEANAEELWDAPRFELGVYRDQDDPLDDLLGDELTEDQLYDEDLEEGEEGEYTEPYEGDVFEDEEDDDLGLFEAAYEDFTYEDSADDGMESEIYDFDDTETRMELEEEAQRLEARLEFLETVARLWKHAAVAWGVRGAAPDDRRAKLDAWRRAASERCLQLSNLLDTVQKHRLPTPRSDHESMVEYDRLRSVKDAILGGAISAGVEMSDAARLLRAAVGAASPEVEPAADGGRAVGAAVGVLRSVLRGDATGVEKHWQPLLRALAAEELLYVPLAKGGDPRKIVRVRALHRLISDLLAWLPRIGLVRETCELLGVAQRMEIEHPVGRGAVTEYDRLFEDGYEAIVRCLVASADAWDPVGPSGEPPDPEATRHSDGLLVQALQDLTESQLERWLRHSKTVRLSVVERLASQREWDRAVKFIERYGEDLFTQRFLTLGNLRAILHQGTQEWLESVADKGEDDETPKLVAELDEVIPTEDAAKQLTVVIEAVVESYREYRDYNATTTQSDHGEALHALIDFLRLKNGYDRVAWNLKPVYLAHKILVSSGRPAAAELWRRAVAERTEQAADQHQAGLRALCEKHGMRLASVADRLGERFVRPLLIDRLRAQVGLAMRGGEGGEAERSGEAFVSLRSEAADLAGATTGAGLDLPDWIVAIEEEVGEQRRRRRQQSHPDESLQRIDQVRLDWAEAQRQLDEVSGEKPG